MSIKELSFNPVITTSDGNISEIFFIPLLKECIIYYRGVGYFSSSWIRYNSKGISEFVKNGGIIKWITSPILSEIDWKHILIGDEAKTNQILKDKLNDAVNDFEKSLNENILLSFAWMIADGIVEIKLALPFNNLNGEFHDKFGYFEDKEGNSLSFQGSNNESVNSITNYESFFILSSCDKSEDIRDKSKLNKTRFLEIWNGRDKNLKVYAIPESVKENIVKLRKESNRPYNISKYIKKKEKMGPRIPDRFTDVRDYQKKAYENWVINHKKGLFAMATGTGKTITALYCALQEFNSVKMENRNNKYQVIVLVPSKTLVDQWEEEIRSFHFFSIIKAYSGKPKWKNEIRKIIDDKRYSDIDSNFFIISTYKSFINSYDKYFSKLNKNTLLIADEVHNMGSPGFLQIIDNISYENRIGLSATPKRIYSPMSSDRICEFLNTDYPYTFNFSMKEAIEKGILTEYYYYPIMVSLSEREFEEYLKISKEIGKLYHYNNNKKPIKKKSNLERLLIKRKRIINGAENKQQALIDIINIIKEDKNKLLEYCIIYAPSGSDYFIEDTEYGLENERIILQMSNLINCEFPNIPQNQYISETTDKEDVITSFRKGFIDLLFAINCLDEGVDIPQTKIGIFTSSTGNPRQFIQRRGRLLRKHPKKDFAYIYDMIVIPPKTGNTYEEEKKLLLNELRRVKYFFELSRNFTHFDNYFQTICDYYKISYLSIDIDEEML